ncbi:Cytochrome P450 [Jatrophihabitans endophyticus]|uniref:Cytochrome P450 n=1 Tax=Jatrophihabitans endophyticus TaxID=1206085 RepID=A0A1M5I7D6_9ACTN|nr:cytochrome P450 [Jatrophihabitans endophyticus]SHG23860.1 Cytochrome P450 [Jatrophihabitans endophyticus]
MSSSTAPTSELTYPMARETVLDPPPTYASLRAEHPITRVRLDFDDSEVWLVTRYEDAKTILTDTRFSSDFQTPGFPARLTSQPPGPGTFIRMDPPDQQRLRHLLHPELSRKRVDELRPTVEGFVAELLDRMIEKGPPADLIADFALPLPSQVITTLLGVPYEDREFFHDTTRVMGEQTTPPEERLRVRNQLKEYLDDLVAAKDAEPGDDLLSRMCERRVEADVSIEEVVGIATLLMVAGYETVANQIGVGTVALLQNPDQLADLKAHPDKIRGAADEIVRHQTVTDYGARRAATADIEVGGTTIRKGDGVLVVLSSANRDESVFTDPDELDINRKTQDHLAFGWGPHQCVGHLLARVQLECAWAALFERLPDLRLDVPLDEVPFRFDMFVYGVRGLPVTW